jgi:uncharacterized protein
MSMKYPTETWFDDRLEVGPSTVHGQGLHTTASIAQGETLMVWGGIAYAQTDLGTELVPANISYSVVAEGVLLAGPEDGKDYFLNHSCEPNVWMEPELSVVASRAIDAGEELLIDYALVESEDGYLIEACTCVSQQCRGLITGLDWTRAEIQRRYRGHFLPFINARIDQLNVTAARDMTS